VSDGAGNLYQASISSIGDSRVTASIESRTAVAAPAPRITVFQGLAKGAKVDWVLTKLVELGVDEVVVFGARRSVPVWDAAKQLAAAERWERLARSAAGQSNRAWLPAVEGPLGWAGVLERVGERGLSLVADPGAGARLRDALPGPEVGDVSLIVGPEGGFEAGEVADLVAAGATAVQLGSQILRTETAGLILAALSLYQLRRLG
jgi:16S rRNA (uracil1498-N3)-methyltransferase